MKLAQIKVYEYQELPDKSKHKADIWLDEMPFDYEVENEDGEIVTEYEYFSEWSEDLKAEHCEINGYLFFENGKPAHHLIEKAA